MALAACKRPPSPPGAPIPRGTEHEDLGSRLDCLTEGEFANEKSVILTLADSCVLPLFRGVADTHPPRCLFWCELVAFDSD